MHRGNGAETMHRDAMVIPGAVVVVQRGMSSIGRAGEYWNDDVGCR